MLREGGEGEVRTTRWRRSGAPVEEIETLTSPSRRGWTFRSEDLGPARAQGDHVSIPVSLSVALASPTSHLNRKLDLVDGVELVGGLLPHEALLSHR